MISLGTKVGVSEVTGLSLHMKSREIIEALEQRLKLARASLSKEQFEALVKGRLNVNSFLKVAQLEQAKPKPFQQSRQATHETYEDSLVMEEA